MTRFHWSTDSTEKLGEFLLDNLRDEALFAITLGGEDVQPHWSDAQTRLLAWYEDATCRHPGTVPFFFTYQVNWYEVTEAILLGGGQPKRYFSDFVDDLQAQHRLVRFDDLNAFASVSAESGGKYSGDTLLIEFHLREPYVGLDAPEAEFTFDVPRNSTVAWINGVSQNAELWWISTLTVLALMGFSIVRCRGKERALAGGTIYKQGGESVTTWFLRTYPPVGYRGESHPERHLLGTANMERFGSGGLGFSYNGDKPWGVEWALGYQEVYDQTITQVNMDTFIDDLRTIDPEGETWGVEWYSGYGTGRMLLVRPYDEIGNVTPVYEKCAENWEAMEEYPILDEDAYMKRENEYIRKEIIERLKRYERNGLLLPGHPDIEDILAYKVEQDLFEGGWQGDIDDFVLEDELMYTVLRDLQVLDVFELDPVDDFMPWAGANSGRGRKHEISVNTLHRKLS